MDEGDFDTKLTNSNFEFTGTIEYIHGPWTYNSGTYRLIYVRDREPNIPSENFGWMAGDGFDSFFICVAKCISVSYPKIDFDESKFIVGAKIKVAGDLIPMAGLKYLLNLQKIEINYPDEKLKILRPYNEFIMSPKETLNGLNRGTIINITHVPWATHYRIELFNVTKKIEIGSEDRPISQFAQYGPDGTRDITIKIEETDKLPNRKTRISFTALKIENGKIIRTGETATKEFITSFSSKTNLAHRLDVNNDGFISPADALGVINSLNNKNSSIKFPDVNGDTIVSPIDYLLIVNALNQSRGGQYIPGLEFRIP